MKHVCNRPDCVREDCTGVHLHGQTPRIADHALLVFRQAEQRAQPPRGRPNRPSPRGHSQSPSPAASLSPSPSKPLTASASLVRLDWFCVLQSSMPAASSRVRLQDQEAEQLVEATAHVTLAGDRGAAAKEAASELALKEQPAVQPTPVSLVGRSSIEQLLMEEIQQARQRELGDAEETTSSSTIERLLSSLDTARYWPSCPDVGLSKADARLCAQETPYSPFANDSSSLASSDPEVRGAKTCWRQLA